jgi:hypothetical protein
LFYGWENSSRAEVSWYAYQVALLVATLGIFVVIAIQILHRELAEARASVTNIARGSAFMVASALTGWLVEALRGQTSSNALFGLSVGLGALAALAISKVVFGAHLQPNNSFEADREA